MTYGHSDTQEPLPCLELQPVTASDVGEGAAATRGAGRLALFGADEAPHRFFSEKRRNSGDIVAWLREVDLLRSLDQKPLERLAAKAVEERYEDEETIYRAGGLSDALYVVRDGAVGVYSDFVGQRLEFLDRITAGGIFGEMGILEQAPRPASAYAMGGATVLRMAADDVREILDNDATFAIRLTVRAISRHCVGSTSRLRFQERYPVGRELELRCGSGGPWSVRLEDLSTTGARFEGVPATRELEGVGHWVLSNGDGRAVLSCAAEVVWRRATSVGVRFLDHSPEHERRIERALVRLVA